MSRNKILREGKTIEEILFPDRDSTDLDVSVERNGVLMLT